MAEELQVPQNESPIPHRTAEGRKPSPVTVEVLVLLGIPEQYLHQGQVQVMRRDKMMTIGILTRDQQVVVAELAKRRPAPLVRILRAIYT